MSLSRLEVARSGSLVSNRSRLETLTLWLKDQNRHPSFIVASLAYGRSNPNVIGKRHAAFLTEAFENFKRNRAVTLKQESLSTVSATDSFELEKGAAPCGGCSATVCLTSTAPRWTPYVAAD